MEKYEIKPIPEGDRVFPLIDIAMEDSHKEG